MFLKRTITTVIGVPLVIALIWFGSPWFTVLIAGWGLGGAFEFYSIIARTKGLAPLTYFGMLWVLLFIISPHFSDIQTVPLLLTSAVLLPLIILLWRKSKENAFANWAWTIAGILYVGWLASFMVGLRLLSDGRGWVFLAILCTFASDISAYLAGRTFGRHKMSPYISPNKTWEGAAAGLVGAIIVSVVVVTLFKLPVGYGEAVGLGVMISIVGQLGDLVKSLFKRNTGVKDSSNMIPGHGGFLDRMDSPAFAGVAVYYYVIYAVQ